jgi:hypothetical protein
MARRPQYRIPERAHPQGAQQAIEALPSRWAAHPGEHDEPWAVAPARYQAVSAPQGLAQPPVQPPVLPAHLLRAWERLGRWAL